MAVKPGYYKIYSEIGFDGINYPITQEQLAIVSITDNTTTGNLVENQALTTTAQDILNGTSIPGFFDSYADSNCYAIRDVGSANLELYKTIIINNLGLIGASVSPYENIVRQDRIYFRNFLDKDKTKLLGEGNFRSGTYSTTYWSFPHFMFDGNNLYYRFPYFVISTDQTQLRYTSFEAYSRYNMNRVALNRLTRDDVLLALFDGVEPWLEDTDPYNEIDPSTPGGGDGTFDFSSTPIDFQGLPGIGAYQTGMIDLYIPSAAQLQALSNYLWAGAFDLDNFRKIVADPMEAILGLSIVPVTAAEIGTGSGVLAVGNISTGITMPTASRQYVSIDCGSVNILPKYGAYLDFAPYCKLQLFLPYIGYVQISPDDCMNGAIAVRYSVDILSGMCVAQVKCNDHVLYELAGSCSCQCPVTAGQYQNIALTALRVASAGAMTGAALAAGSVGGVTGGIEDAANSIISSVKPEIERSGGFGGSSGLMGHQVPYLILTIPRMCRPLRQNQIIGYPSFVTVALGDITGYAAVAEIHLHGIPGASDEDLAEIENLLKEGVYL